MAMLGEQMRVAKKLGLMEFNDLSANAVPPLAYNPISNDDLLHPGYTAYYQKGHTALMAESEILRERDVKGDVALSDGIARTRAQLYNLEYQSKMIDGLKLNTVNLSRQTSSGG